MTCGLVHSIYSLPEWQPVKLTFFAPCQNKDFGTVSQTELTRNLVPSVAQASVRKQNENY